MQGAVLYGPGDLRFEDRDDPKIPSPTDAIIRIAAAGYHQDRRLDWLKSAGLSIGRQFLVFPTSRRSRARAGLRMRAQADVVPWPLLTSRDVLV